MPKVSITNMDHINSVCHHYIAELRDRDIQQDPMRFRKNLERIATLIGFELSKELAYQPASVTSPLGIAKTKKIEDTLVIASILRAGLTMHDGLLAVFDRAENAFVSAYRKATSDHSVEVKIEYMACPEIDGKTILLTDPMLATGKSLVLAYEALLKNGTPKQLFVIAALASEEAISYLQAQLPNGTRLFVGAIDPSLNAKSYIVPGFGDAGDLAFGPKKSL